MTTEVTTGVSLSDSIRQLREATDACTARWSGKDVRTVTQDMQSSLQALESNIRIMTKKASDVAAKQDLTLEEATNLYSSEVELKSAVAELQTIEKKAVIIDVSSWGLTKLVKKIWAAFTRCAVVEVDHPVSRFANPVKEVHKLCSGKFGEILESPVEYRAEGEFQNVTITVRGKDENLLEQLKIKCFVQPEAHIDSKAKAEEVLSALVVDPDDMEETNKAEKNLYFIQKHPEEKKSVVGAFKDTVLGAYKAVMGGSDEKAEPVAPQDLELVGYDLYVDGKPIPIKFKEGHLAATIDGKEITWNTWKDFEAKAGKKSGFEFLKNCLDKMEKDRATIDTFLDKIGVTSLNNFNKTDLFSQDEVVVGFTVSQTVGPCLQQKDGEKEIPIDTSSPGTLVVNFEGKKIQLWPGSLKDLRTNLAMILSVKEEKILITEKEIQASIANKNGLVAQLSAMKSFSEEEFKLAVAEVGGPAAEHSFIFSNVDSSSKCKLSYVSGGQIKEKDIFLDKKQFKVGEECYANLDSLLKNFGLEEGKRVSPEDLRKRVSDRKGLMETIEINSAYKPLLKDMELSSDFKKLFGTYPWRIAHSEGLKAMSIRKKLKRLMSFGGRGGWVSWGVEKIVSGVVSGVDSALSIVPGYSMIKGYMGAKEEKWDYRIKRSENQAEDLILQPVFENGSWKISVEGEAKKYQNLDEVIQAKGLKQDERLDVIEKRSKEIKKELLKAKPELDYGKAFFHGELSTQQIEILKKDLKSHSDSAEHPIGTIVYDTERKKYFWLFAKKDSPVEEKEIVFTISREPKFTIDGKGFSEMNEALKRDGILHVYSYQGYLDSVKEQQEQARSEEAERAKAKADIAKMAKTFEGTAARFMLDVKTPSELVRKLVEKRGGVSKDQRLYGCYKDEPSGCYIMCRVKKDSTDLFRIKPEAKGFTVESASYTGKDPTWKASGKDEGSTWIGVLGHEVAVSFYEIDLPKASRQTPVSSAASGAQAVPPRSASSVVATPAVHQPAAAPSPVVVVETAGGLGKISRFQNEIINELKAKTLDTILRTNNGVFTPLATTYLAEPTRDQYDKAKYLLVLYNTVNHSARKYKDSALSAIRAEMKKLENGLPPDDWNWLKRHSEIP